MRAQVNVWAPSVKGQYTWLRSAKCHTTSFQAHTHTHIKIIVYKIKVHTVFQHVSAVLHKIYLHTQIISSGAIK